jgi:Golgi nucleoside diphosphatase
MYSRTVSDVNQKGDAEKSVNFYFDLVCKYAPVIKKSLVDYGNRSIADYVNAYSLPGEPGYQKKDDFFEQVYEYLVPLQGTVIARQAVQDLTETPWILTANHHGVDFFAQSVQSSLLFSLILSS